MALVMARDVPTSSETLAVPHGPASVGTVRRRMRQDLGRHRVPEGVIDDAVLILSELLSNACRHARPLGPAELSARARRGPAAQPQTPPSEPVAPASLPPAPAEAAADPGRVVVRWELHGDGRLTVEVTDGGGLTRPRHSIAPITAHGGRGLGIVGELAADWGVRSTPGEQTVWAVLTAARRPAALTAPANALPAPDHDAAPAAS